MRWWSLVLDRDLKVATIRNGSCGDPVTTADIPRMLRNDYRSFRVDRVGDLADTDPDPARIAGIDPPVSLDSYIRAMEQQAACAVPSSAPQ